jgi:hypothetical protein
MNQPGCDTFVHESNARNISVYLSLSHLAKILCLSYYCLFLLFNGTGEKLRTGSACKGGGREGEWGRGQEGEMIQTMYANVNK